MQSRNSNFSAWPIGFAIIVLGIVIIDACAARGHTETSVAESANPARRAASVDPKTALQAG